MLKIRRQADPGTPSYWEEFKVPLKTNMNVVAALMEIQKNPVNALGQKTLPVVWDCSCLEEVCGACTMVINGRARQVCSALVETLSQPIILEPLSKFPVVRDLMVDRSVMFEYLKKVKAWIEIDGTHDLGPGPRVPQSVQSWAYELSRCMTCGCCMEACPQVNHRSNFMGPAAMAQVRLFNAHPLGESLKAERLGAIMGPGGITDCGKAQNCEKACPKGLPLTRILGELSRETTRRGILGWLSR
ncbi:succinate dehydrogenase [Clostridiales bacterium PH28_bin88]|nr:succinate dehydrogenase [Clostridiales bacterium PH28_bin88]